MSTGAASIILLAGPTASGKTGLSIRLAKAVDGEIVNADSMQLYADLQILSARPGTDEQGGVPHHIFGVLDAAERASVGWWQRQALSLIQEIRARGRRPILVGGTGLYFEALTRGLAEMPEISAETRAKTDEIAAGGNGPLQEAARNFDAAATERIDANDLQRLRRIVEIGLQTGQPITAFQADTAPPLAAGDWTGLVTDIDRAELYRRIEARFDAMIAAGALDEARTLADRDLDPDLPAMKAIGVPPLIAFIRGELDMADAISQAKQDSRRYAKRQLTWFRNRMAGWPRVTFPYRQTDIDNVIFRLGNCRG
ncbi:tRNA (adenosine(37)-N6)-dimethylallyltransferase MiaA [Hyphobacterium sp.]|uniref:tRNA (adenosine(37)-N6)-dimethylallyltransferase MiaA n=1 Tax=Hyphobacterium sp. TaxID=2004662 RepID=UPI003BA891BA